VFVLLTGAVHADDVTLKSAQLKETLRDKAQISGVFVTGVVGTGAPDAARPSLHVHLPEGWAGDAFCISVLSADGLYESRNTYVASQAWPGGTVRIPYPTRYPRALSELNGGEVGVIARQGDCAAARAGAVVPAYWNQQPDDEADELLVLLNSFRADEAYVFVGSAPDAPVAPCRALETMIRTAFDMLCPVELPEGHGGTLELEINRVESGVLAPPHFVDIRLGE
jgi:hypothetical protein